MSPAIATCRPGSKKTCCGSLLFSATTTSNTPGITDGSIENTFQVTAGS
jgi:hypothetical protein